MLVPVTALVHHVVDVRLGGPEEQMVGVDAGRIVALVERVETERDRADMKDPTDPVGDVKFPA